MEHARREADLAQREREVSARERQYEERQTLLLCDTAALRKMGRPNWHAAPVQWHALGRRLWICWVCTVSLLCLNLLCEVSLDLAYASESAARSSMAVEDGMDLGEGDNAATLAKAPAVGNSPKKSSSALRMLAALNSSSSSSSSDSSMSNFSSIIPGELHALGSSVYGAAEAISSSISSAVQTTTTPALSASSTAPDGSDGSGGGGGGESGGGTSNGGGQLASGQSGLATLLALGVPVATWLGWCQPLAEAALVNGHASDNASRAALVLLACHGLFCLLSAIAPAGCGLASLPVALATARSGYRLLALASFALGTGFACVGALSVGLHRWVVRSRLVEWLEHDGPSPAALASAAESQKSRIAYGRI